MSDYQMYYYLGYKHIFIDCRYQLAESMDSQMKQMSEDLKGIIEHLNESNKEEDANDPVSNYFLIRYLFKHKL